MSFLRPRTISVSRPTASHGYGASTTYGGVDEDQETLIHSNLPANIFWARTGQSLDSDLPSRAMWRAIFKIVFDAPEGTVEQRDIITDNLGNRYQVVSAEYSAFGYSCLTEQLQL